MPVILKTSFHDMNQKICVRKKKKKKGYFQNFSRFQSIRDYLLCQIKSRRRDFMRKLFLFHTEMISA